MVMGFSNGCGGALRWAAVGVVVWGLGATGCGSTVTVIGSEVADPCPPGTVRNGSSCVEAETLAIGVNFACHIKEDGTLWCWGSNDSGQLGTGAQGGVITSPRRVGSHDDWWWVSAAGHRACGLRGAGNAWCWGFDPTDELAQDKTSPSPIEHAGRWKMLSISTHHACGIDQDGSMWCWGRNDSQQLGVVTEEQCDSDPCSTMPRRVGDASDWHWVAVSGSTSCGLRNDGERWCWGGSRLFGDGSKLDPLATQATPKRVDSHRWRTIDLRGSGCGVRQDGSGWCWGHLPGLQDPELLPVRVDESNEWQRIRPGESNTCGVQTDGTVKCWGSNSVGQLGAPDFGGSGLLPVAPERDWHTVATGYSHQNAGSCGVRLDDSLWCWGSNVAGRLGVGTTASKSEPVPGLFLPTSTISTGSRTTCAIDSKASALWCWGVELHKPPRMPSRARPVRLPGYDYSAVSVGRHYACAIKSVGLHCWGRLSWDDPLVAEPTLLDEGDWTAVSVAISVPAHGCGLRADASLLCWGYSELSQLGSDKLLQPTPKPVAGGASWKAVSVGWAHGCAIRVDGSIWCWGRNGNGQLGLKIADSAIPVQIGVDSGWSQVSAGAKHTCALRDDASLWCWGWNDHGQITGKADNEKLLPTQLPGLWSSVACGYDSTCAIKVDGTASCWGSSGSFHYKPLGPEPWHVSPLVPGTTWTSISAGDAHGCGVDSSGTSSCWGYGAYGQLGDGEGLSPSPVRVLQP